MRKLIIIMMAILAFGSCRPQDSEYKDLYNSAIGRTYPHMASNLVAEGGYLNAKLSWDIPVSPVCKEAIVYWRNQKDSLRLSLSDPSIIEGDRINVTINDLAEEDYTFDVYIIDKAGNRSRKNQKTVTVIGPLYISGLGYRSITGTSLNELARSADVKWGDIPSLCVYSELRYTKKTGGQTVVRVSNEESSTHIEDIDLSVSKDVEYRSAFVLSVLPDTLLSGWNVKTLEVDPDYAEELEPGVEPLTFKNSKNVSVVQDPDNKNIFSVTCTGASDFRMMTNPMKVKVQGPVLVFHYKQNKQTTKIRIYWINEGEGADRYKMTEIDMSSYKYGTGLWNVAKIYMGDMFEKNSWEGKVGDYARVDIYTETGNVITIKNAHFRPKREGEFGD